MRTWLRQMGLTLRLVAAGYLSVNHLRRLVWTKAHSKAPGLLLQTSHCAVMVGGIEWSDGSWMSHQRCAGWLGGKAEFPCGLPGRL